MIDEKFLKYYDFPAVRKICAYMIKKNVRIEYGEQTCVLIILLEIVNQTWRNPSLIVFINI